MGSNPTLSAKENLTEKKYTSLARKYRPQSFDEIFGQDVAVKILQNSILTKRIHHAYIFAGVRGTGKTTAARIFAKALNCEKGPTPNPCGVCQNCKEITQGNFIDLIEMDAGSQTSVEDIRSIKEKAIFPPARGRFKVFIIDEAHMLSLSAFNALLKIFEEPPDFDIFILATTEPHKIPETVASRAIRIDFRKIPKEKIVQRLEIICQNEGIEYEKEALELIAEEGQGSLRDSISILEGIWMYNGDKKITRQDVEEIIGIAPQSVVIKLLESIIEGDHKKALEIADSVLEKGYNTKRIARDLADITKDLILIISGPKKEKEDKNKDLIGKARWDEISLLLERVQPQLEHLMRIYNGIIRFEDDLRASVSEEIAFRMFVFKLSYIHRIKSFKEIIEEIRRGGVEIKETKKKSKEEIFSQIVDFLRQRARDLLADKLQQASYELSDNYLTIFLDDQRIIRSLAEMKEDIEEFIRESVGESITLKLELRKQKEEIDVEKILGDEFEKFEPEMGIELW